MKYIFYEYKELNTIKVIFFKLYTLSVTFPKVIKEIFGGE